jgi:hypothetical protein
VQKASRNPADWAVNRPASSLGDCSRRYPPDLRERTVRMVAARSDQQFGGDFNRGIACEIEGAHRALRAVLIDGDHARRDAASDLSAPEEIRTPNLLIRSQMLYPLSYGRLCSVMSITSGGDPLRPASPRLRSPLGGGERI